MSNAAFFVQQARAAGRTPDPQDINPATGRPWTGFEDATVPVLRRAQRASRSPNNGMTLGPNPQRRVLGVDAQQRAEEDYAYQHRSDSAFSAMRAARQADKNPYIGHETDAQFEANNEAEMPMGRPVPKVKPVAPLPPGTVAVAGGGQDDLPGAKGGMPVRPDSGVVAYSGYRKGAGLAGAPPTPAPATPQPDLPSVSGMMKSKPDLTPPPLPPPSSAPAASTPTANSGASKLQISVPTGPSIMSGSTIPDSDVVGKISPTVALNLKNKKPKNGFEAAADDETDESGNVA